MPPKEQTELPGVRPVHMKRLEEIEDDMEKIDEKISKLRKERRALNDEAVSLWQENDLAAKGSRVRGSNEWYLDQASPKYKRRRFKDSEDAPGETKKSAKKDKATA